MNGLIEVATYDAAEGSLEKKPKEYQEFMYDTQTNGGILEGFAKTRELTAAIAEDVEEIKRQFNALIEIYDQFTGYNDTMTSIGNRMTDCSDRIKKFNDNVIKLMLNEDYFVNKEERYQLFTKKEETEIDRALEGSKN